MGTTKPVDGRAPVHSFYSSQSWIEGEATRQLDEVAALPGVTAVAGMPDLHPGKYGPVGCAILADAIHPRLVGSDIGCGMGLFQCDVPVRKLRLDRVAERFATLEGRWDGDIAGTLTAAALQPNACDDALGTVGGGNHFCELQAVDEVFAADVASRAGLDREHAVLLVHSGSRGRGHAVLMRVLQSGVTTLDSNGAAGCAYLAEHDAAMRWAVVNRGVIAARAGEAVRAAMRPLADVSHNFVELTGAGVLHRKGAAPADRGLVPVPGSRGTLSYLVEPLAADRRETLASLAHGAGRKYDRGSMYGRVRTKKSDLAVLTRNPYGGYVVCEDRALLIEEAPDAYKGIDRVIADLEDFGLARVVATLRPLVTFKTARDPEQRSHEAGRRFRRGGKRAEGDWR